ncbi:hypothetical protein [Bacillus thuringiensis]|uniref:hypothetical protein n=1 Tax=Bacillus thuringiensis TaxID=1428 RepID=UPI00159C947E|nr:hypothetical protein [Bacillus thuringiensis]
MKKFETKEEMINAYGAHLQIALTKEGETLADLDWCNEEASDSVIYVAGRMVPMVASFLPEKINSWYIPSFGYCAA